jgi:hypothetical protein
MKRRDFNDFRDEGTKNDEDAMDVEQTPGQPPLGEATASRRAKEHTTDQLASTDRKDMEDGH